MKRIAPFAILLSCLVCVALSFNDYDQEMEMMDTSTQDEQVQSGVPEYSESLEFPEYEMDVHSNDEIDIQSVDQMDITGQDQFDESFEEDMSVLNFGNACWKRSYGRGVGKPLSNCRTGEEKNGALCYPKCKSGYKGVGPVCWQNCPSNLRNDGAFCAKPAAYGRGAGYALWSESTCKKKHSQGCEKSGLMWYPRCKSGYKPVGCCVCSPICPSGMRDIGVSCTKKSYGRGAGKPMICASGLHEQAGLCYKKCDAGYDAHGPVCWKRCPSKAPHKCGALCVAKPSDCAGRILQMGKESLELTANAASKNIVGAIGSAVSFANQFNLPICA